VTARAAALGARHEVGPRQWMPKAASVLNDTAVRTRLDQLSGLVERVTFHNGDSGFCVLRLKVKGEREVIGHTPTVTPGEYASASGNWVTDREHGRQFRCVFLKIAPPNTLVGIERYLGSGVVKGIGPVYAARLVEAFGTGVFDVIEQTPERVREIAGIGAKRAKKITSGWADQKVIREIMVFLHANGVSTARGEINRSVQHARNCFGRRSLPMKHRTRTFQSDSQKALMGSAGRGRRQQIAKLFDRSHGSLRGILAVLDGIRPAEQHRAEVALTLAEREEICVPWGQVNRSEQSPLFSAEFHPIPALVSSARIRSSGDNRPRRCAGVQIHRVERSRGADEKPVQLGPPEAHISHGLGHPDLAQELTFGCIAMHAVASARPQIASGVNAKAVKEARGAVGKNFAARKAGHRLLL
jgi:hypothetical protein